MNRRGSAIIILIFVVVILLIAGGVWYYEAHKPIITQPPLPQGVASSTAPTTASPQAATLPPFSFSCPQDGTTTLIAYESQQMGIAFCYPSDLTVTTNTITWPTVGTSTPQISFWILNEKLGGTIAGDGGTYLFDDLASCDASGSQGDDYCIYPKQNQITEGKNPNGFNYVLFRHDIVFGNEGEVPYKSINNNDAGPSAFVPLISQNYLAFAIVDSLYQANGFGSLPAYVDKDLLEILNTVSVMPEQYTGIGLTLTTNAAGKIAVYNVIANSPALAAGIKDGDIVAEVDGTSTTSMSLDDVTNILDAASGTVTLGIQGENDQTSTTVNLIPAKFVVSGSDLGGMYQNPF